MIPSISTRAATEQDEAFLFALFRSVRLPEFAHAQLPPPQLDLLMNLQYNGQKATYGAQYPDGDQIVLADGEPIGRIWVYRVAGEHQLVDISLMPELRNRGIGAALPHRQRRVVGGLREISGALFGAGLVADWRHGRDAGRVRARDGAAGHGWSDARGRRVPVA